MRRRSPPWDVLRPRSRSPPRRRDSSSNSYSSYSSSSSSLVGRRAGWRPELGPLANPLLRDACGLEEGLRRLRQEPALRQEAIAAGFFSQVRRPCRQCGGVHVHLVLSPRGRDAWLAYHRELTLRHLDDRLRLQ